VIGGIHRVLHDVFDREHPLSPDHRVLRGQRYRGDRNSYDREILTEVHFLFSFDSDRLIPAFIDNYGVTAESDVRPD
jgi:hypothetical protein